LVKPILLLALSGGLVLSVLLAAYHPVMVWALRERPIHQIFRH